MCHSQVPVGGLEHFILFFHMLGMSSSQLIFIFFRGVGEKPPTRVGSELVSEMILMGSCHGLDPVEASNGSSQWLEFSRKRRCRYAMIVMICLGPRLPSFFKKWYRKINRKMGIQHFIGDCSMTIVGGFKYRRDVPFFKILLQRFL